MSAYGPRASRLARETGEPGGSRSDEAAALARAHPLASFGLDALVAGAARPRPEALALSDADGDLSYAEFARAAGACLARLREAGFARGERALLIGAPRAQTVVALTALVAAGLEPVLAPAHARPGALISAARALSAACVLAPARFGGLDLEETLHAVAAAAPSVRLLGSLGGGGLDGALDLSRAALLADGAPRAALHDSWAQDERVPIGAPDADGAPAFLPQGALLARALELVRAMRAGGAAPVLSLVSPASFAGLVAGPLAALLAGAPLHFHAPFDAAEFLQMLEAIGPARLVAPAAALPDIARAGLLEGGALVSVTAIGECPGAFSCERPVVSIDANGAIRPPPTEGGECRAIIARTA